jgi:hypothetical protein
MVVDPVEARQRARMLLAADEEEERLLLDGRDQNGTEMAMLAEEIEP